MGIYVSRVYGSLIAVYAISKANFWVLLDILLDLNDLSLTFEKGRGDFCVSLRANYRDLPIKRH